MFFTKSHSKSRLGRSWGDLGAVLGRSWAVLGPSWGGLGRSWDRLGDFWGGLGTPGGPRPPSAMPQEVEFRGGSPPRLTSKLVY